MKQQERRERTHRQILDAALRIFREKGYAATTVEDICRHAGVTKGAFFYYFPDKEALALSALNHWNQWTGELFSRIKDHPLEDPKERLMAYLDFRAKLVRGELPDFTCLIGTLVQETYASHPKIRCACEAGIQSHIRILLPVIESAKARYAPDAAWCPQSLARYIQTVLQGAFILAKATNNPRVVKESITHLKQYVDQLLS